MACKVTPVVLSGGAGTRLWPLSRALRPKQLLPLVTSKSLLQETVLRTADGGFEKPLIVCNHEHRFMIAEQLQELGITSEAVVLEPEARNTAPAVAAAALYLAHKHKSREGVILVMPSDHVIANAEGFMEAVKTAVGVAEKGALVTFGIKPTRPETGYGYVRRGAPFDGIANSFHVAEFIEKPEMKVAETYLADGGFYWNSGLFVFPIDLFLSELERLRPDIFAACQQAVRQSTSDLDFIRLAKEPFARADSISVDYAVMEKTDKAALVPADMAWSDVGSWSALWEISRRQENGNVTIGDAILHDVHNSYVRSDGRLIAAVGVSDLVVVDTDDVTLVARKDRDQDVKRVVEEIARSGRTEHYTPRQVFRPWGWYRVLHQGFRFQVKEILVKPGEKLSAQMHHHRAEHWIIVSGTAKVTKDNESFFIVENESTYIPHTTRHSLENPGRIPLLMIEVQSGPYLGEDDIVRFDDRYGRAPAEPKA